jgi:preprotein translocase subunit SecY
MKRFKEFLSYYKLVCLSKVTLGWTVLFALVSQFDGWSLYRFSMAILVMLVLTLTTTFYILLEEQIKKEKENKNKTK